MRRFLLGLMLLVAGLPASGAEPSIQVRKLEPGAASPSAEIADIAWLQGRWVGEGLGGTAEDLIASPVDGEMMGMFRHVKADGTINFYEFYLFAEANGSLTQRLKHFSRPLRSWEDKDEFVEFPLVAIEDDAVYFDGLTYRREPDDGLTVGVRVDEDRVAVFRYRRAD